MKRPATTRIDESIGQEIAVREGIRALVAPSISGVGGNYRLAARIRDVASGHDVKTAVVKARSAERILDGLDQLAAKVRGDLGESLLAISRNSRPLAGVTTASLEALKQYSIAIEMHSQSNYREAKVYYQNALNIDPGFTAARGSLGMIEWQLFDRENGRQLLAEAIRSIDNLTDREKYGLLAFHAQAVEGNFEKAANYHKILIGVYPDFALGHNNLGIVYRAMGLYQQATEEFKEALRIDPGLRISFDNLALTQVVFQGDLDGAIESCRTQIAKNGQWASPYGWMGYANLGKRMLEEGVRNLERAIELNAALFVSRHSLAVAYLLLRRKQEAVNVLNGTIRLDPRECVAYYYLGLTYELAGDATAARKQWERSVECRREQLHAHPKDASEYLEMAIALARLGETGAAAVAAEKGLAIDPSLHFDEARLHCVQGKTHEALASLELAEKTGFNDFVWIRIHPDLQSVATHPRVMALLRRHLKCMEAGCGL